VRFDLRFGIIDSFSCCFDFFIAIVAGSLFVAILSIVSIVSVVAVAIVPVVSIVGFDSFDLEY
jgi:hypothetical protein